MEIVCDAEELFVTLVAEDKRSESVTVLSVLTPTILNVKSPKTPLPLAVLKDAPVAMVVNAAPSSESAKIVVALAMDGKPMIATHTIKDRVSNFAEFNMCLSSRGLRWPTSLCVFPGPLWKRPCDSF